MTNDQPMTHERSPHWPAVRAAHLRVQPACAYSGATSHLEVHHILPFHLFPDLELDPDNLITLSEHSDVLGGMNCHLVIGHFGDWKNYNPGVVHDAARFLAALIATRAA